MRGIEVVLKCTLSTTGTLCQWSWRLWTFWHGVSDVNIGLDSILAELWIQLHWSLLLLFYLTPKCCGNPSPGALYFICSVYPISLFDLWVHPSGLLRNPPLQCKKGAYLRRYDKGDKESKFLSLEEGGDILCRDIRGITKELWCLFAKEVEVLCDCQAACKIFRNNALKLKVWCKLVIDLESEISSLFLPVQFLITHHTHTGSPFELCKSELKKLWIHW